MYKKFVSALYMLNIIAQSIVTLVIPAALMFLISWLITTNLSAPMWIYAILIPIGVISGFFSMIKFVIRVSEGVERLEKERDNKRTRNR